MFGPNAQTTDVESVREILSHRGPDDAGTYRGKSVALGFQRLSFLDLTPSGHQPMRFGDLVIIFNGEVYNFREIRAELTNLGHEFASNGDTETVLHAYAQWGSQCLDRFNGMYAFVIINTTTDEVFLVRDRLGVKPLYYALHDGNLLVASEVQGLLKLGLRPSWNWKAIQRQTVLTSYYGYDEGETVLEGVHELPPATYGILKPGETLKIHSYWRLPENEVISGNDDAIIGMVRETWSKAVELTLVSDVPIATFLSGGIDSSGITALSARHQRIPAFTLVYTEPGIAHGGSVDSDHEYANIVGEHLGNRIDRHVVTLSPAEISLANVDLTIDLASISDDTRYLSILANYRAIKAAGFKGVLNGQGPDETWGGYVGIGRLADAVMDGIRLDQPQFEDVVRERFGKMTIPNLAMLRPEVRSSSTNFISQAVGKLTDLPGNRLQQAHRFMTLGSLRRILRFEDFLSMGAPAVECRLPFLDDHRMVELAFRIPHERNIRMVNGQRVGKWFLREALRGMVPDSVIDRPKQTFPFNNPEGTAHTVRTLIRAHEESVFASPLVQGVYDIHALRQELDNLNHLQAWHVLGLWRMGEVYNRLIN